MSQLWRSSCAPIAGRLAERESSHAHLESDGDSTPAEVVRWYAEHGYDVLVVTDHDKVTPVDDARGLVLIPDVHDSR